MQQAGPKRVKAMGMPANDWPVRPYVVDYVLYNSIKKV
jgi:hypothetical protein